MRASVWNAVYEATFLTGELQDAELLFQLVEGMNGQEEELAEDGSLMKREP